MWRAVMAAAFLVVASAAIAQSAGSTRPFSAMSPDRLVDRYEDLAGSRQNAETMVKALRDGIDFMLRSDESVTIFHPPAVKMSDANIDNALAITQAALKARSIDKPKPDQVGTMLMDVLQMRAEGKRWVEVADAFGFKTPK